MLDTLVIRSLTADDEDAFHRATSTWDHSSGFQWSTPQPSQNFSEWIWLLRQYESGFELPKAWVPYSVLYGFVGDEIVGRLSIRHQLNDHLLKIGGHIGYGVVPPYRRRGYATALLAGALPTCKKLGLKKILVTCDDDNIGSAKTIEKNGGRLENSLLDSATQKLKRRYWIEL